MTAQAASSTDLRTLFEGMDLVVPSMPICEITSNSRYAVRGGLFLACAGLRQHGLDFLDQALAAGIAAVAWETASGIDVPELPDAVVGMEVPGLTAKLGTIADRFFGSPSAALAVTGVTGTNGKTTTAFLVAQALNDLQQRAGYMGTIGYGIGADLEPSSLTTPGCITVHRRLRQLADLGARHVIAEVSSHALDQQRVNGVRFRVAALTNLSRDHLDYHGSIERYAEAKARLFIGAAGDHRIGTAVINVGDSFGAALANRLPSGTDVITVALVNTDDGAPTARLIGRLTGTRSDGLGLQLAGDFGEATLNSLLWGRFNAENLAVATGILLALGLSLEAAVAALGRCVAPPGRMELIRSQQAAPTIVIDYAHTPDALRQILETVRDHCDGHVWCVFGCGGERDQGKRRAMGEIAALLADRSVITDDNPRDEDPAAIRADIVAGAKLVTGGVPGGDAGIEVVPDRRNAIEFAIRSAQTGDIVVIAGKGHETRQLVGAEARAFSDSAVARSVLGRAE